MAVQDKRPYVVDNKKRSNFVGFSKSIYGIPYDVTTQSGNSLSDYFSLLIAETLKNNGINVITVRTTPHAGRNELIGMMLGAIDLNNYILITLNDWKTEVHFRAALFYNVSLDVLDNQGEILASANQNGFHYFDNNIPGKENLASSVADIFGKLFNNTNVVEALSIKN